MSSTHSSTGALGRSSLPNMTRLEGPASAPSAPFGVLGLRDSICSGGRHLGAQCFHACSGTLLS